MRRRIQPIPSTCPLRLFRPLLRPGQALGVWVAAATRPPGAAIQPWGRLLLSADLAVLLASVERVAAWDGDRLRTLPGGARRAG
ncbi:MAG: hypothetical protein ACREOF_15070 [Gemmatimonadales bacterium]